MDFIDLFDKQLQEALKLYHEPKTLGEQSPLATPYFLSSKLSASVITAPQRGELLRTLLYQASRQLWGDEELPTNKHQIKQRAEQALQAGQKEPYYYLLLELRYFRQHFTARNDPQSRQAILDYLLTTKSPYNDNLMQARAALAQRLLSLVQPALRLEQVIAPKRLFGRTTIMATCHQQLQARQLVSLNGGSGAGKTTVGMAIASHWPTSHCFWYTIRPHFSDQLAHLLFALGHFLHQHRPSALWAQLMASGGHIQDLHLALGLARHDLARLRDRQLLLGFDELNQNSTDDQNIQRNLLLEFVIGLRGEVAILAIGQQSLLEADYAYTLTGLSVEDVAQWLTETKVAYNTQEVIALQNYTHGNPRLLTLLLLATHEEPTVKAILEGLPHAPYLELVVARLWRYFPLSTRQMLQRLAVFPTPAPFDAFADDERLPMLQQHQVVQVDQEGGILLMPALRDAIYRAMPVETQEACHQQAAILRIERGEFTAAAYHYWQAKRADFAIQIWFPNRQLEVNRGQSATALTIFAQISLQQLSKNEQIALQLIRAELYKLTGESVKGLTSLAELELPPNQESIRVQELRGDFLQNLSQRDAAIQTYETGIQTALALLNQLVILHTKQAMTQIRQRDNQAARRIAQQARCEVEILQGTVADEVYGHYDEAIIHFQQAWAIAKAINFEVGIARTCRHLAVVYSKRQMVTDAISYSQQAISYYEKIGDYLSSTHCKSNLAGTYLNAGYYAECIDLATEVLPFLQQTQNHFLLGNTAANLAEAYYHLDQLAEAQTTAELVITQGEKHSHPYALLTLGLVQRKQGVIQSAIQTLESGNAIAQSNNDLYIQSYILYELGITLPMTGRAAEARSALEHALQLFTQLGIQQEIEKAQRDLSSL